jgi:glycosyltransferase involved in cell wall biosynthesis
LSTCYWPEVRRGTERLVHDLATGLASRGWEARIVAGHAGPTSRAFEDGVQVVRRHRLSERVPRLFGYPEPVGHLPGTWSELRRAQAGLTHSFGLYEGALASLTNGRDVPTVFTVTGIPQRAVVEGRLWRRRALRRVLETSDAITVLSEAALAATDWLGGERRVLAPGVDLAAFRRTTERAPHPTLLCTAALDDPRKRVPLVIEAFREVRRRRPDARLILSRRGAAHGAASGGLEYRDLDTHDALVEAYSEAWATVLASQAEAFGLVAVESLACGTPVVASADAGIAEAVGGEGPHSRLFTGDDPARLAGALLAGLELAEDEGAEPACRRQAERFSLERFLDEHLRLYAELGLQHEGAVSNAADD